MANFNFNKVILGGRLTAEPELKQTNNGISVCTFSIAVNRRTQESETKTDFFNCTAWRTQAEFINKYFIKGSSICIEGSVQNRTWTDQQGQKRYATDIIANNAYFVDGKTDNKATEDNITVADFEQLQNDDDLPF